MSFDLSFFSPLNFPAPERVEAGAFINYNLQFVNLYFLYAFLNTRFVEQWNTQVKYHILCICITLALYKFFPFFVKFYCCYAIIIIEINLYIITHNERLFHTIFFSWFSSIIINYKFIPLDRNYITLESLRLLPRA